MVPVSEEVAVAPRGGTGEAGLAGGPAPCGPGLEALLRRWNDTGAEFPDACVHELFERQVDRAPDAVALVSGSRRLTYGELDRRANQLARNLRELGAGVDSLVGVCLERCPELVVALLGTWKAGAAYVPLDPTYPRERLAFMVQDAGLRILLTQEGCLPLLPPVDAALCLDTGWDRVARASPERLASGAAPSNLAYVIYTSGSTGLPKGAMIHHRGLVNYLWWAIGAYAAKAGGSVPVHSSISFDLTVTSLYPALLAGGQVELLPEDQGAQQLLAALRRSGGRDLVKITPAHLELLTRQVGPEEAGGLTGTFVIGGENLTAESLATWRDHAPGTRLINEYGPTETVVGCCVYEVQPGDPRHGSVPIGRPIANTQLYVLGPDGQPVPPGAAGELFIGGAGVARGYLNRPELTAERFVPDRFSGVPGARLYRTGDLARARGDGILEYLGRLDHQVKVRGYRIELGEIEATLAGHPAVQSCAVLAREDAPGDRQLVAYVVQRPGATAGERDLQAFLGERLPDYMVPSRVVTLPGLPLTVNGKVDRNALPAPAAAEPAREAVPARNERERALVAVWAELLNARDVGIHDDFFDLGGHSLLVMRALSRIRDLFGTEVPAHLFFENPTPAALAAALEAGGPEAEERPRIPRRAGTGHAPASFSQERFWFLANLLPDSPAYNVADVLPIRGEYRAPAMRAALGALVGRHEILRTSLREEGGRLVQVVGPADPQALDLREVDLGGHPEAEREEAWDRAVHGEARRPFDLSRGPLLRAMVAHVSPAEHRLMLTVHHVLVDEWSMELIRRDLAELYAAQLEGRPPLLPELPIQYADYAAWQREVLQGGALDRQIEYWKRELEGAPPVLALPTDRPRPRAPSFRGETETFALPRALLDRLHALGRSEQATPFMVLGAAFAALLHRYTGQEDVLVGTPISLRREGETEGLVGCFLNTVVLRARFAADDTFRSLLRQARRRVLGAFEHPELPFERLVAELAPDRDPARTPLLQVLFVLHEPGRSSRVSTVAGNREMATGTSKFDLTLVLSEGEQRLDGLIEYSTDLFDAETIRGMCRCYGALLEAIARDADESLARLPLLAEADRRRLLVERKGAAEARPRGEPGLHHLFELQAARAPGRVALAMGAETLTYGELDRRSTRLARRLAALGVGPDALVGILTERSPEMVVALLGILKAGGAYVPLDPAFPPERLAYMVADSRMQVLVTHRGLESILPAPPASVVHLDREEEVPAEERRASPPVQRDHPAYVLYTSGSTGRPKGVAVPHRAIVNFLLSMEREPGLAAGDVLLAVTTLSFDIAALELFLPLATGAQIVLAGREEALDARRLAGLLRSSGATVMQATPVTWRALVGAGWDGAPGLKILCGGEALPPDLARALLPRCAELWNMYGPTETTVWSTVHRVGPADGTIPIGRPIDNTVTLVLDAYRNLAPPGAVGELYIGGEGLALGYLHRPELTRERFVANPFSPGELLYRTGDLARWRSDGRLECLGRTDHQVKVRGHRIELGEIEAGLARHPSVRASVAVVREDGAGEKQLVAYFAGKGGAVPVEELRALLRRSLPEYMIPSAFVQLEALPQTPNGKIDRKALPAPGAGSAPPAARVAPRNDLEIALVTAWERVLGIPGGVGVTDSFFDLGGTSLGLLRLVVEMEQATGLQVSLGAIFETPTIAGLAESLGSAAAQAASVVVPLQPAGEGVPLFCLCGIELYREFARSLGTEQPVFGVYVAEEQALTDQALQGRLPEVSVERLAEAYERAILRVAPEGPYRLAGVSFGGILAMAVASRMRQRGAEVELVVLLDCILPQAFRRRWLKRLRGIVTDVTRHPGRWLADKAARLRDKLAPPPAAPGGARRAEEAFDIKQAAFYRAVRSWKGQRLAADFRVVLVRASAHDWGSHIEFKEDYGWGALVTGPFSIVHADGNHLGILASPGVGDLGRALQPFLGTR